MNRILFAFLLALPLAGCSLLTARLQAAETALPTEVQVALVLPSPSATPEKSPTKAQPTPTRRPTDTPVPSPTSSPTVTFTPEPSPTPTATPTTAPDVLFDEAAVLCDAAFNRNVDGGQVLGPYLSLFQVEYESESWEYRPNPFQEASAAEEVANVVCTSQTRYQDGKYEDGEVGYRLTWQIRILSWPDGRLLSARTMSGDKPPGVKFGSGPGYGLPPAREAARYLAEMTGRENFWVSDRAVLDLTFGPNGRFLLIGEAKPRTARWSGTYTSKVQVWDMTRGGIAHALSGLGAVDKVIESVAVAISPDGKLAAASGNDMSILVWNLNSGEVLHTLRGHGFAPVTLAFSPDNRNLASGDVETVRMWNLSTGSMVWEREHNGGQPRLVFDAQSGDLAVGFPYARSPSTIYLDAASGQPAGRDAWVGAVLGIAADGGLVVEISAREISLIHTASGEGPDVRHSLSEIPQSSANALKKGLIAVAAGLSRVAFRDLSGNIGVCELSETAFCWTIPAQNANIWALALSPDGRYLAVGTEEGIVNIIDLEGE